MSSHPQFAIFFESTFDFFRWRRTLFFLSPDTVSVNRDHLPVKVVIVLLMPPRRG